MGMMEPHNPYPKRWKSGHYMTIYDYINTRNYLTSWNHLTYLKCGNTFYIFYLSGRYFMREACPPTSDWTLFANVKECADTLPSQQMSNFWNFKALVRHMILSLIPLGDGRRRRRWAEEPCCCHWMQLHLRLPGVLGWFATVRYTRHLALVCTCLHSDD